MASPIASPISVSSLQGLQNAAAQFDSAAATIAKLPSAAPSLGSGDIVDLSAAMVLMMTARDAFLANVKTAQTGDELQQTLLSMIG